MSYSYSKEEMALPEFSGRGEVVRSDVEYYVEHRINGGNKAWLDGMAAQGWRLVSVDQGQHYFERSGFYLYEQIGNDFTRIKPGPNS